MVVYAACCWDDFGAQTPPTGTTPTFTERYNPASGTALYVADGPLSPAGATGNKTIAGVASNGWGASLVFIQAAGVGGTRGMPFGTRSTAFNGGRTFKGPIH
jgi:hypothetical protein